MACYLNKYVTNNFNVRTSVSIDTKMYGCKIWAYKIEYLYGTQFIARVGHALVVC